MFRNNRKNTIRTTIIGVSLFSFAGVLFPTNALARVENNTKTIVLGLHNNQTQNASAFIGKKRTRIPARINCNITMASTISEMKQIRDNSEGLPALVSGCGSAKSFKYATGPMSPENSSEDWTRYSGWLQRGVVSATPTVSEYKKFLLRVKKVFGKKLEKWQVWNEVDLSTFYRGTPKDLVDLTFAAAEVFGAKKVVAPSWSPTTVSGGQYASGAYVGNRFLTRNEMFTQY